MVGSNNSVLGGIIAASTLLIISYFLSSLLFKSANLRKILNGEQTILIYNGTYEENNLKKMQITHDELESIVREHGCEGVNNIHSAVLEMDGAISIIPITEGKKPKVYKYNRKRSKYHQIKEI